MGNPNRFNQFRAEIATNRLAPATSNLWEFRLPPPVFMASQFGRFNSDVRETVSNINYFANSVTVPSRAVTTGEGDWVNAQFTSTHTNPDSDLESEVYVEYYHIVDGKVREWNQYKRDVLK